MSSDRDDNDKSGVHANGQALKKYNAVIANNRFVNVVCIMHAEAGTIVRVIFIRNMVQCAIN